MRAEKTDSKEKDEKSRIEKELFIDRKNGWEILAKEKKEVFRFCEDYKEFLNNNKSEREIVEWAVRIAKKNGFVNIEDATATAKKIYAINHHKNIVLIDLGGGKLADGMRIIAAHCDTLRLDFKPSPVYETDSFAMINLHYYGGIKKYHWLNVPLAIHGVIFNKKGEKINISLGEKEDEPVFVISDLLPHLEGSDGREKLAKDIIKGEDMDAIAASMPIEDKKVKEKLKATLLKGLNDKYKITESDFISAELALYPVVKARDVGIDEALIGAPAHDDRVCSYLAIQSILDSKGNNPKLAFLVDKEEIGSTGNTSMDSFFLENLVDRIAKLRKENVSAKEVLAKSKAISADVTSALDPKFADKSDPMNTNRLGYGISVEKYTGSGGKYYGSDANAEYISWMRGVLDSANVPWQYGEIGKVDQGGGGTIAYVLAKYNMNIVDMGPPVLAMHSPFEIASKADIYSAFKAYKAFYEHK